MYIVFDGDDLDGFRARYEIYDNLDQVRSYLKCVFDRRQNLNNISVHELGKEIEIKLNEVPFKGLESK